MSRLLRALRVFYAIYHAEITEVERYDAFSMQLQNKWASTAISERQRHDAYLQWRLTILQDASRKSDFLRTIALLTQSRRRLLILIAMAMLICAVLFPPFQLLAGGQSLHLGFGKVLNSHIGTIDSIFLLSEILVIGALYWLADRLLVSLESSASTRPGA